MAANKLKLTRDQLASFLKNNEQIKQFEQLFAIADAIAPDVVNEVSDTATNALSSATQALANIIAVNQTLEQENAVLNSKIEQVSGIVKSLSNKIDSETSVLNSKVQQAIDLINSVSSKTSVLLSTCENKANVAFSSIEKLSDAVEGLQIVPPPKEFKRSRYGAFYDTTTQTATTINTATAITFNTTSISKGVYIGSPTSRIYVDTEGIYNFQTSIQLDKTSGGTAEFYIWFRLNGADVTDSASQIRIQGNDAEIFSALNFFFNLKANDYVELMFSVSDLSVELLSVAAAAPVPGIPSIILTVSNNIGGVQ